MQNDDVQLTRLRPFEAAARLESFTRAADELGLTQTAVSRQIGQLEAELGLRLFERRNRAVFLTDEGRRLGRVVGDALAAIRSEVASLRGSRAPGTVVLRCQLCEAFYWLMPRLSRFHARHPDVQLQLVSAIAPLTQATEPFDVALQTTGRASGAARLLFTAADSIFPVCAPSLLADHPGPLAPASLLELPLLSHRVTPQDWFDWPDWLATAGLPHTSRLRKVSFDSYPLVLQAAVAGQGVALGWNRTVAGLIEDGKLRAACNLSVDRPSEISVFRGSRRGSHAAVDSLIAWLKAELA
ncbi:LysR substrate-binding domain-containing protein [Roseivivax sediminis]|uniref:DNA-binding transcriptional regulator, LysR family n=1 Tax=Roseivivax sediminis TaxID=936889 RepID=A0A1I1WSD7_9RHOB|nr:LysR substrate-binding domain-containing protein [Roseivivax sediminis]SFD97959.1 DNA-binding transcriptional regulator, LysR family [Roseivivax sediminis]